MTAHRLSPLVRWSLIICVLLLIFKVTAELIAYPAVVTTAGVQAPVYLILFVLALLVYSWLTLFRTRAATREQFIALRVGTFWGLLCGAAWVIELMVANVVSFQLGWLHLLLYYGSTWAGYLLPGLAGMIVHLWIGLVTGFFLGVLGGTLGKALARSARADS